MMSTRASKRGRASSGVPLAAHRKDRDYASTILSVLDGAHSMGDGVLGFFDTREARVIRLVCAEFRDAVAVVPWADTTTHNSRKPSLRHSTLGSAHLSPRSVSRARHPDAGPR